MLLLMTFVSIVDLNSHNLTQTIFELMLLSVTVKLFFFFALLILPFLFCIFFLNLTHMICLDPNVSVCPTVLHCEIKCL